MTQATDSASTRARTLVGRRRLSQWTVSRIWGYLFILPFMALFLAFNVAPSLYSFWLSVVKFRPLGVSPFVGLENFAKVVRNPLFWTAMWNTIRYVLMVVPAGVVISLVMAILIYSVPSSIVRQFYQSAFLLPGAVSGLAVAIIWRYMFDNEMGLLNYALSVLGLGRLNWLGDVKIALPSLAFMALLGGGGGTIIIFVAALGGIPTELYDAAMIDGANMVRKHLTITLPLLTPSILYVVVMNTLGAFQVFTPVYVMTGGGPLNRTMTVSYLLYRELIAYVNIGGASAMGLLLVAACLGLTIAQFRWFSNVVEY